MPVEAIEEPPVVTTQGGTQDMPKVIRRDDLNSTNDKPRVVPWMGFKIARAVQGACEAVDADQSIGEKVQKNIEANMQVEHPLFIHIEQLQDLVEETLLEMGEGKVAIAYAKYRARRAALREARALEPEEDADQLELTSTEILKDIRLRVSFAIINLDLGEFSENDLIARLLRSVTPDLTEEERQNTIILNAKALLDLDADFRYFAARILLTFIYEETLEWKIADGIDKLKIAHQEAFKTYIPKGIALKRLDPRLDEFDLDSIAEAIDPYSDLQFDFLGIQTLYDRYLIHYKPDSTSSRKVRLETPQIFWMRVAMGLALLEDNRESRAKEFYSIYKSRRACSSTPTLFNSGSLRPQLSSCYLLYCGDSIDEITETWVRFSHLSKWAGGLGCSWTAVRGTGSHIAGTNGESSGVIPFLKVSNDIALAVNQGGKRPGALCSYLETWHNDIDDFLDLRKETGDERRRTHNMNTANWIPDLFMKRLKDIADGKLEKDTTWTLLRASDATDLHDLFGKAFEERYLEYEQMVEEGKIFGKKVRVLALWKKMIEALFETGHPWMTFKDPCNLRSPQDHAGVVHSSNLCTEITLNTSRDEVAVCNLGSVNIADHLNEDGSINDDKLQETVITLMRMLDNVIDINFYPTEAAANANLRHRPVGMGVMGLQDALYKKRVPFDSPEAVEFNDEMMEKIAYHAYSASANLAKERGCYSTFKGSKWDKGMLPLDSLEHLEEQRGVNIMVDRKVRLDWNGLRQKIQKNGMRNSNCLAIAPTATIGNIMGTTPCIEPVFKHMFTKSNLSGDFVYTNGFLVRELRELNLWDQQMREDLKYFDGSISSIDRIPEDIKRRYLTAFEIEPTWVLQAAAVRQKWIDQSQSVNLFLGDNDARKASFMYREAWERGLKTTYYLRTFNQSGYDNTMRDRKRKELEEAETKKDSNDSPEPSACSIEAARRGEVCESCQ
ncbi:MAG: ribonucleoside-diphosphate reductase subunit alpha [Verrucomicrobiota bacterium]